EPANCAGPRAARLSSATDRCDQPFLVPASPLTRDIPKIERQDRRNLVAPGSARFFEREISLQAAQCSEWNVLPRFRVEKGLRHGFPDFDAAGVCVVLAHDASLRLIDWLHNQTMGRPSNRAKRREEIVRAFAKVLANHGYAGATIAAVAAEAEIAPGLVHHHF